MYRRRGRHGWETKVLNAGSKWRRLPLGTTSRKGGEDLERLLKLLQEELAFDILDQVGDHRALDTTTLWQAWLRAKGSIPRLRAILNDTDLTQHVEQFEKFLAGKVAPDTAQHYVAAVRDLFGAEEKDGELVMPPLRESELTAGYIQDWIDNQEGAPATVRKHGIAVRRFVEYIRRVHKRLPLGDPCADLELPPPGPPRIHFLETSEVVALVQASEGIHQPLGAYLAGSGVDLSTGLKLRPRDVSKADREVRAPGTKTWNRDRIVRVADWAWPILEEALEGKGPNATVFAEVRDRWVAQRAHRAVTEKLVKDGHTIYDGYTIRDHRHTWAVRAAKSGWPIELIARQLGHKDGVLALKVYSRFNPNSKERDRWEAIATEYDRQAALV